jgi:hypothetical protein
MSGVPTSVRPALLIWVFACLLAASTGRGQAQVVAPINQPAGTSHDVSMDDYRRHLQALAPIVEACAKARDTKTCDPALVGPDDRVQWREGGNAVRRVIRYDWLRALLARAQLTDEPATKTNAGSQPAQNLSGTEPARPTTSQLLKDAVARLNHDLAQAGGTATALPSHGAERDALNQVLASREFRNLEEQSPRDTVLEKMGNAINRFFNRVARFSARSRWIGRLAVWGFLGAVCVGLMWGLLQLERRWRIRLVPEQTGPAPDAASARDWQLWLEDARRAAADGRWREAVHFVYWAAISRLESKRLWPADRARTPREYLALVATEDPRRAGLATLTGSFERIWYGGRAAGEGEYRAAEQLASRLISGDAGSAG